MGIMRRLFFLAGPVTAALVAAAPAPPPPPAPRAPLPAYAVPEITKLPPDIKIRASADSFESLVAAVKPDFSWGHCYLLWIRDSATDHPSFELNRAWLYEPAGAKPQCVLLSAAKDLTEALEALLGNEAGGCFFPLTTGPAPSWQRISRACGSGDFLRIATSTKEYGTVYEINWEGETDQHSFSEEMPLFLSRDPAGKWHFLGIGPVPGTAAIAEHDVFALQFSADKASAAGVSILFTLKHVETDTAANHPLPGAALLPNLVEFHDAVLDGNSPELHFAAHAYMMAAAGDTLETLLRQRLAWEWLGHADTPEVRAKMEAGWRAAWQKLNPTLSNPSQSLAPGTKVYLPEAETLHALVEAARH